MPLVYSPQLHSLITTLALNQIQIDWLANNPLYIYELNHWLNNEVDDEENKIAALVSLDHKIYGLEDGPYDQAYLDIINTHLPNPVPSLAGMVILNKYTSYQRASYVILKEENPNWSVARLMWESNKEALQLMLDFAGTVPIIGEVADLTNGVIYTISGDRVNASLSFTAAIPFVGWYAFGTKMAKRVVNLTSGGKVVLR